MAFFRAYEKRGSPWGPRLLHHEKLLLPDHIVFQLVDNYLAMKTKITDFKK